MIDPVEFGKAMGALVRDAIAPLLKRIEGLESAPQPERGEKGEPGEPGPEGPQGRDGRDGMPGRDGTNGVDGRDGEKGMDGKDGRDGADGLGFDDLTVEYDGARGFVFKFQRGDVVKSFPFTLPVVLDAGYWRDGMEAKAGDGVTCGGSYWIAKRDTAGKPGQSDDWRLAVKKGRDGSNGKDGEPGERGQKGEKGQPGLNGRDLR